MKLKVVFYKKKHDKGAEIFAGTYTRPGDAPSEWQKLQEKPELKNISTKFMLTEYEDKNDLPGTLPQRINMSVYINLLFGDEESSNLSFPKGMPLTAGGISTWILQNWKARSKSQQAQAAQAVQESEPEPQQSRSFFSLGSRSATNVETQEVQHEEESFAKSWRLPVSILGGAAGIAAAVMAVAVAQDFTDDVQETDNLMFVDNKGNEIVDFRDIRWNDEDQQNDFDDDEGAIL